MAIILPHGVLFRGGVEATIRRKLLDDGHVDTVIGLPANLFYSTGIPVCILVLKKCKKPDDVLFINAAEGFVKDKRQNRLEQGHIDRIVATYRTREERPKYARRVSMTEIAENDYNPTSRGTSARRRRRRRSIWRRRMRSWSGSRRSYGGRRMRTMGL